MAHVAVVTDSTAMLPPQVLGAPDLRVVPTAVVVGGDVYDDGAPEATPEAILEAMRAKRPVPVSTSRPTPIRFATVYAELAEAGFDEIVSVHLSAEMSGTLQSAQLAARTAPVPVVTVDTRTVGPCLAFAVMAAVVVTRDGGSAEEAGKAAMDRADRTRSLFYVDTLDYLRRGGRIGAAARLVGSALAVKPLLAIEDGRIVLHERVRTSARALARLEDLAVEAAADQQVEIAVAHVGAEDRAATLAAGLQERLAGGLEDIRLGDLSAVLGAHVGPGMIAVVVAPSLL